MFPPLPIANKTAVINAAEPEDLRLLQEALTGLKFVQKWMADHRLSRGVGLLIAMSALCGVAPGDRFIVAGALRATGLETPAQPATLLDERGLAADIDELADRVLTVRGLDPSTHTISFTLADSALAYHTMADAAQIGLRGLAAVVNDSESAALNARLADRDAWTVTQLQAICASRPGDPLHVFDSDVRVHIEHVVRLADFPTQFVNVGKLGGAVGYSYTAANPLLVTFRISHEIVRNGKTCDEFSARFAGSWDLDRQFRPASLRAAHPEWSASDFAEVEAGRILVGMSREQIVAMYGYPSIPGTIHEIDGLDKWFYAEGGPFGWTVYFHGDRVWAYDPPGRLP